MAKFNRFTYGHKKLSKRKKNLEQTPGRANAPINFAEFVNGINTLLTDPVFKAKIEANFAKMISSLTDPVFKAKIEASFAKNVASFTDAIRKSTFLKPKVDF